MSTRGAANIRCKQRTASTEPQDEPIHAVQHKGVPQPPRAASRTRHWFSPLVLCCPAVHTLQAKIRKHRTAKHRTSKHRTASTEPQAQNRQAWAYSRGAAPGRTPSFPEQHHERGAGSPLRFFAAQQYNLSTWTMLQIKRIHPGGGTLYSKLGVRLIEASRVQP